MFSILPIPMKMPWVLECFGSPHGYAKLPSKAQGRWTLVAGLLCWATPTSIGETGSLVQFSLSNYDATEGSAFQLKVEIVPPSTNSSLQVTIRPAIEKENTASWDDVDSQSHGTVRMEVPIGAPSFVLWGVALDDGRPEADETMAFNIVSVSGGAVLGVRTNATLTIHNQPATLYASVRATEGEPLNLSAGRRGDTNMAVTATYLITNGTARPYIDYVPTNGTISIKAGERTAASIMLTNLVLDNGTVDGDRTLTVVLSGDESILMAQPKSDWFIQDNEIANSLDRNFKVPSWQSVRQIGMEPDGRLLVVERQYDGAAALRRLLPNGSWDPTFNAPFQGKEFQSYWAQRASRQSDGDWLVLLDDEPFDDVPARLVRLKPDGSLDKSFNPAVGGVHRSEIRNSADRGYMPANAFSFLAQPDGAILVNVLQTNRPNNLILRLAPDGSIDAAFRPIYSESRLWLLAVSPEGKFLVDFAQSSSVAGRLGLFFSNGAPDSSFRADAFEDWPENDNQVQSRFHQALIQSNHKVILLSNTSSDSGGWLSKLTRLLPNGAIDPAFQPPARLGKLQLISLGTNETLLAGHEGYSTPSVVRFQSNGSIADTWPLPFFVSDFAVQPDGKLIAEVLLDLFSSTLFRLDLTRTFRPGVAIATDSGCPLCPWDSMLRSGLLELNEEQGSQLFIARRLGETSQSLTIELETKDRTAQVGEDYTSIDKMLHFAAFEVEKEVRLAILDDHQAERDEEFSLSWRPLEQGLPEVQTLTVRILDNEPSRMFTSWPSLELNTIRLDFNAPSDEKWQIEGSSDLMTWSSRGILGNLQGSTRRSWFDDEVSFRTRRYYRAVRIN